MRNGVASPMAMAWKITKIFKVVDVKAKAIAVPRNGAEHGVDRIVVSTPVRKSPIKLFLISIFPSLLPPGILNSNSPKRLNIRIVRTKIIIRINLGDWSWKPHPT